MDRPESLGCSQPSPQVQWFCCTWLSELFNAVRCQAEGWAGPERYRKRVCSRACTMGTTVLLTVRAVCWVSVSLTELRRVSL